MENNELQQIADKWTQMTHTVLNLKQIPAEKLQSLLKDTYVVFAVFCKDETVPVGIIRIFLEMEDFLYFAFLMDKKEFNGDYILYRRVNAVIKALETGFFCGDYGFGFPRLRIIEDTTELVFDFENDLLEDMVL